MVGRGLPVVRPARLAASAALPEVAQWRQTAFCRAEREGSCAAVVSGMGGGSFVPLMFHQRSVVVPDCAWPGGRGWRTARPAGERPCFARIACGCGRASAPARFARLIARARQRAHFACALNQGRSAPDRHGREAARGCPFPRTHHTTPILRSSPIRELLPNSLEASAAPPPPGLCQPAGSSSRLSAIAACMSAPPALARPGAESIQIEPKLEPNPKPSPRPPSRGPEPPSKPGEAPAVWTPDLRFAPSGVTIKAARSTSFQLERAVL